MDGKENEVSIEIHELQTIPFDDNDSISDPLLEEINAVQLFPETVENIVENLPEILGFDGKSVRTYIPVTYNYDVIGDYIKSRLKSDELIPSNEYLGKRVRKYISFLEEDHRRVKFFESVDGESNLLHNICKYVFNEEELIQFVVKFYARNNLLHAMDMDFREALHQAAVCGNYFVLKALLEEFMDRDAVNRYWQGSTALEMIICGVYIDTCYDDKQNERTVQQIEDTENYKNACNCLKLLIDAQADVNRRNFEEKSPVELAVCFGFQQMVKIILGNSTEQFVDIDTKYFERKSARELIIEKGFYPIDELPARWAYNMKKVDQLFQYLRFKEEDKFVHELKKEDGRRPTDIVDLDNQSYTLLQLACKQRLPNAVKILLKYGANANRFIPQNVEIPINIGLSNNPDDEEGMKITSLLLKNGASLTAASMVSEYIKKYFDTYCITPYQHNMSTGRLLTPSSVKIMETIVTYDFTPLLPLAENDSYTPKSEMNVIEYLATTSKLRELLQHPLITAFLFLKWYRMRWFFYSSVAIFFGLTVSLFCYIYQRINAEAHASKYVLISFICIMIIKETVELYILGSKYLISSKIGKTSTLVDVNIQNLFEFGLGIYVGIILLYDCSASRDETYECSKLFYIVAVLSASAGLLQSFEQLPHVNYQISMLKKVTYNIFKSLLLYTVIFIAFAFSFTILHKEKSNYLNTKATSINDTAEEKEEGPPNYFDTISFSMFKTIIMMTGEFELNDTFGNFEKYRLGSSILFLIFIFVVVLICFNLLIGLAVSDIQAIRKNAEMLSLMARWQHIRYVELLLEPFQIKDKFLITKVGRNKCIYVNLSCRAEFVPDVNLYFDRSKHVSFLYKILYFFNLDFWQLKFGKTVQTDTMQILQEQQRKYRDVKKLNKEKPLKKYEQLAMKFGKIHTI